MDLNSKHVSEFSPDGKLFALINENGILKIWDTETNELRQEFTPNLHLAAPCTCLTWVVISRQQRKDRSKKQRKSLENSDGSEQMYLALGTSKGGVTMYSYNLGKIERSFQGEGHSGRVNSIVYDKSTLLYTTGDDGTVVLWNVAEERKIVSWLIGSEKLQSITCLPLSGNILIGARELKLYTPEGPELIQTFTGHASEITILSHFVHNSVEYALSASKMERIISMWTLTTKRKNKTPSCTFLMEDIAHCFCSSIDAEGNIKIAAVTRSGVIHIYVNNIESVTAEKPIKPKTTMQIVSDSSSQIAPIPAIAVSYQHGTETKEILFGYGDKHFLRFEHISPNYTEKLQVLTREDPKNVQLQNSKKKNENALKTITPIVNANDVEYTSTATVSKKRIKPVQIPMETRLQNLHLENGEFPKAESKVQLLIQALHSKDSTLMSVLSTNDPKVIQLTLQKLPVQYIDSLVNELTLLMNKKRNNVQIASNWLKVLVQTHSSQLMALGTNNLLTKFGPCLGIIEHKTNCLKELSKLNGRLHLLLNQIRQHSDADTLNADNALVYEDQDSSSSDMDVPYYTRDSSDDEWEEDDSVEEMDVAKDNDE